VKRIEYRVDGKRVRGALFEPRTKPRAGAPLVLLAHGLASCRVEWYQFPQRLADSGLAVLALDFRGHGESEGPRGYNSMERAREDLAGALKALQTRAGVNTERVGLVGHSLGASLSLAAAPDLPNVRCLVALAPVRRLRDEMAAWEFLGYNAARLVNAPVAVLLRSSLRIPYKVDYGRLYEDPTAVARARRDRFLQAWLPINAYRPLVQELDGEAAARRVRVPTLVAVAAKDQVVKLASSRAVYEALPGPKEWAQLPHSGHSMAGDLESDVLGARAVTFLHHHLGART
jgi:acylglycerol lipase